MKGLTDKRSGLAKRLSDSAVPTRILDGHSARLNGLALRALPVGEIQKSTAAALAYLTSTEMGLHDDHLFTELGEQALDVETKCQILFRALVDPNDPTAPFAASVDEVRALDADEITVLFNEFAAFQEERSPLSRARSWEEVEGFLEALGKGSVPRTRLNSFDASSLKFMLHELADRHWKPTSSPSSPTSHGDAPGESSSNSSDAPSKATETGTPP